MPRKVAALSPLGKSIHEFLYYRHEEAAAKRRKESAYKPSKTAARDNIIVKAIINNGELDESTGSYTWKFNDPMVIVNKEVTALTWQRSTGYQINEDAAQELARAKGLVSKVTHTETVWDYDEFYVLNQKGKITDDELDSLITESESWSLRVTEE